MKSFIKALLLFSLFQTVLAFAAGQPFTKNQFDSLMKEGKPVIVHIHAPWCSNCKAQDPVLNSEMKSPAYKGVTFLEADFDTQKSVLKEFKGCDTKKSLRCQTLQCGVPLIGLLRGIDPCQFFLG